MKIFNIIMNRKLGGAEQAFLDYNQALISTGHQVINITSAFARLNQKKIKTLKLPNLFPWCIISKIYLKLLIFIHKPDLIIAHGGRAINFSCSFRRKSAPQIVGVTHSYGIKHILKCDYIIALDESLRNNVIKNGYLESKIFIIPNMINVPVERKTPHIIKNNTYIIGAMGRFVPEKGFNYLIEAISILKNKNYNVKLKLGGFGSLKPNLTKLIKTLNLEKNVDFIGWVKDKDDFFNNIDIFCVPSTFETFGIVALESMSHEIPTIVTNTGGLKIIVDHEIDGLIAEISSGSELANSIARIIDNPDMAQKLSHNAYHKILNKYDIKIVTTILSDALEKICLSKAL